VTQILEAIGNWIIVLIQHGTYSAILLLMAVESACIPLPSEIIMPFAGYLVSKGILSLWLVAIAGALGCNFGSTLAYAVGAWGGRSIISRWGRFVMLDRADLDIAERFFQRFGSLAVLIGRLIPVVRTFIALPAGIARMSWWRFQVYTFVGSVLWCLTLAYVGQLLGDQWDKNASLKAAFHGADFLLVGLLIVALAWFIWRRRRRHD
jgi:LPXTG-motif cell wall-anchored protein